MRRGIGAKLAAAVLGVVAVGCGGGSSGGGSGGSLNFRPVWEQRSVRGGSAEVSTAPGVPLTRGSFGPDLPSAVKTVRIAFDADSGPRCCLAVDPTRLPIDPASGRRFLVLSELPEGGATVHLAGFAADFAPVDDAVTICPSEPPDAGQPCDPTRVAAPSFESDQRRVTITSGIQNDAGDIPVFAVPFILNLGPDAGSTVVNPIAVTFTVADAATGIDRQSVSVEVLQNNQPVPSASLSLTACDDATGTPCSTGSALRVSGFHVVRQPQQLQLGVVATHLQARNLAAPVRAVDLTYQFNVEEGPPTPVGSGTRTPPVTRTPTATPVGSVVIVRPGASIANAAKAVPPGSTIIVAPGLYAPVELRSGDASGPVTFVADVTGELTESGGAAVTIGGRGDRAGIHLSGQSNLTFDGFTVRSALRTGILVEQSANVVIKNCVVTDTRGDGLSFDDISGGLALNNLVFGNSGAGIRVQDGRRVRVLSNTLYQNRNGGIVIGDAGEPSSTITVRNNIVNLNTPAGMAVDPSTAAYDADFNLNTDGYAPDTPPGVHDIIGDSANPLFIAPSREDFHLQKGVSGSKSPAVDAGDPALDDEIAQALGGRTTQTDGSIDTSPLDLGYHYPAAPATPTPRPQPTRTVTPQATATTTARS